MVAGIGTIKRLLFGVPSSQSREMERPLSRSRQRLNNWPEETFVSTSHSIRSMLGPGVNELASKYKREWPLPLDLDKKMVDEVLKMLFELPNATGLLRLMRFNRERGIYPIDYGVIASSSHAANRDIGYELCLFEARVPRGIGSIDAIGAPLSRIIEIYDGIKESLSEDEINEIAKMLTEKDWEGGYAERVLSHPRVSPRLLEEMIVERWKKARPWIDPSRRLKIDMNVLARILFSHSIHDQAGILMYFSEGKCGDYRELLWDIVNHENISPRVIAEFLSLLAGQRCVTKGGAVIGYNKVYRPPKEDSFLFGLITVSRSPRIDYVPATTAYTREIEWGNVDFAGRILKNLFAVKRKAALRSLKRINEKLADKLKDILTEEQKKGERADYKGGKENE